MGNRLCTAEKIPEEHLKPSGIYGDVNAIDYKKLRKLIIKKKLAPCYPGQDDDAEGLDECPICFLGYPALNTTRCCGKDICTECFLQLQVQSAAESQRTGHLGHHCPFCKCKALAIVFVPKTAEEREQQRIEAERVKEAQARALKEEQERNERRWARRREQEEQRRRESEATPGTPDPSSPTPEAPRAAPSPSPAPASAPSPPPHAAAAQQPAGSDNDDDWDPFEGYRHEADERIERAMAEREEARRRRARNAQSDWVRRLREQAQDFIPEDVLRSLDEGALQGADLEELLLNVAILSSIQPPGGVTAAGTEAAEEGDDDIPEEVLAMSLVDAGALDCAGSSGTATTPREGEPSGSGIGTSSGEAPVPSGRPSGRTSERPSSAVSGGAVNGFGGAGKEEAGGRGRGGEGAEASGAGRRAEEKPGGAAEGSEPPGWGSGAALVGESGGRGARRSGDGSVEEDEGRESAEGARQSSQDGAPSTPSATAQSRVPESMCCSSATVSPTSIVVHRPRGNSNAVVPAPERSADSSYEPSTPRSYARQPGVRRSDGGGGQSGAGAGAGPRLSDCAASQSAATDAWGGGVTVGGAPCTRDSDELQRARSARGAPGAALVGERPRTAAAGALASLAEKQEASETSRLTVNEARGVETGKAGAGAQPGAAKAAVHPKGGGDGGYIGEASSRELEVPDGAAGGAGPERVSLAAVKVGDAVARVRTAAGDAVVLGTVAHSDAGLVARLEEADRALRARYVDGEGEGEAM